MEDETNSSVIRSLLVPLLPFASSSSEELIVNETETAPGSNAASDRVHSIQSNVVLWAIIDVLLVFSILAGNTLTILALQYSRKLRSVISNMFVLSLAVSDMVVGFTLPFHLAFYMTTGLGDIEHWCLLRFFLIILACCVSIWNLTAIAVDRYIAIMYPLHYSRYMNRKVAIVLLGVGWTLSFILAAIPIFWNNWSTAVECEFDEVLPPWYVAGVITPPFCIVWTCLLFAYFRIWLVASRQVKQLRSTPFADRRVSDWKSVQVVLLILGCFSICWLPYFIVACIQIFSLFDHSSPVLYKCAFSLAMANSGMNPVIYAWKNKNFRRAFGLLLRCQNPDKAYRDNCHIPNNSRNVTSPAKRGIKQIPAITSGSENASACSDRESQCSDATAAAPVQISTANCNKNNSQSMGGGGGEGGGGRVDEVATITGQLLHNMLRDVCIADEPFSEEGPQCRNGSAISTSSSTGTEATDDSYAP